MPAAPVISLKRARRFRRALTAPELGLWLRLRNGRLEGYHFRRQHPVGPYILDFYCAAAKLAVEIDGYSHGLEGRAEHDARRDQWLAGQGIQTLRLGTQVCKDPVAATGLILEALRRLAPSTASRSPSPAARERSLES